MSTTATKKPAPPPVVCRTVVECRDGFITLTNSPNNLPDRPYRIRIMQPGTTRDIVLDMTPATFHELKVQMSNLQSAVYKRDNP